MTIRRLIIAACASALAATGVQAAHAEEEVLDYDVGGGAAAVQVRIDAQQYDLFPALLNGRDRIVYNNATPSVTMGKDGGNRARKITTQRIGSLVRVNAGLVTIKGNRQGTPFAEGTTELTGITIQGSPIKALSTYCRWDKFGAPVGRVRVTDANGQTYEPAPNTEVPLPGIGRLILNEQFIDDRWIPIDDRGNYVMQRVIYVHGARIEIGTDSEPLGLDYDGTEIILGLTSCDPVKLPNISGLKLISSPT